MQESCWMMQRRPHWVFSAPLIRALTWLFFRCPAAILSFGPQPQVFARSARGSMPRNFRPWASRRAMKIVCKSLLCLLLYAGPASAQSPIPAGVGPAI